MKPRAKTQRFSRPEEARAIEVTEDDISLLWHIFRHRVIDSRSLYALFPSRSNQVISRRLRRLWENDFVDRPLAQNRAVLHTKGSPNVVYAIAKEGARLLRDQFDAPILPARWKLKNKKLKPLSIQHHLSITRFMVYMAVAAQEHVSASIEYADTLLRDSKQTKRASAGLNNTLRTRVLWYGTSTEQGTAPDQIFAVTINGETQNIFLEIDEGTETVEPGAQKLRTERFWRETSFLRKMAIYAAAFRLGAHKREFGLPVFRVLTVTTSTERITTMQEAYKKHLAQGDTKTPPGLFLFADWPSIEAHEGSLFALPLVNAAGRAVTLEL